MQVANSKLPRIGRGRPRITTPEDLQDAAYELFIEYGYGATNSGMITNVCGSSRSTFFNYYQQKSDVLWLQTDASIEQFVQLIQQNTHEPDIFETIVNAVLTVAKTWDANSVPWIYNNFDVLGAPQAIFEGAGPRVAAVHSCITTALIERDAQLESAKYHQAAGLCAGAIASGVLAWASSGTSRGELTPYLAAALTPIKAAFLAHLT